MLPENEKSYVFCGIVLTSLFGSGEKRTKQRGREEEAESKEKTLQISLPLRVWVGVQAKVCSAG
jgi:hypothetical protein